MAVMTVPAGAAGRTGFGRSTESPFGIDYSLACSTATLEQAFRLVHDRYVARGYMRPEASQWRLGIHHVLPTTKVFVAKSGNRVVGTMTLIPDSPLGLPMDALYGRELTPFRDQLRYVAEVSSLAIADNVGTSGVPILTSLTRLLILYAMEIGGCDDVVIAVNPRHAGFYRRLFPHSLEIGGRRAYHKVNGAPAVAARLDVQLLAKLLPAVQDGTADVNDTYRFFMRADDFSMICAQLRHEASKARLTPKQFQHFFSAHPALAQAPAEARAVVQALYPAVDVEAIVEQYWTRADAHLSYDDLSLAFMPA